LRPKGSGRSIKDPSYISFLVLSPLSSILPHKKQNTHHNKHAQNDSLSLSLSLSLSHLCVCLWIWKSSESSPPASSGIIQQWAKTRGLMVSWLCTPLIIANKFKPATVKIGNVSTTKFIIISTENELFRELHIVDMSEEHFLLVNTHTHTQIYIYFSLSLSLYVCVWIWKSSPAYPPPASLGIIIKGDTKHILFV
jgi:hypothetical protein